MHDSHVPHRQVGRQGRTRAPQLPQGCDSKSPASQSPPPEHVLQALQVHESLHDRVCVPTPHTPQPCDSVAPGEHTPPPVHALHSDHVRSSRQLRVRVPQ